MENKIEKQNELIIGTLLSVVIGIISAIGILIIFSGGYLQLRLEDIYSYDFIINLFNPNRGALGCYMILFVLFGGITGGFISMRIPTTGKYVSRFYRIIFSFIFGCLGGITSLFTCFGTYLFLFSLAG